MLRYKTEIRPGLVALYDIRPGNGAGQFLQPQSAHGASGLKKTQNDAATRAINSVTIHAFTYTQYQHWTDRPAKTTSHSACIACGRAIKMQAPSTLRTEAH